MELEYEDESLLLPLVHMLCNVLTALSILCLVPLLTKDINVHYGWL